MLPREVEVWVVPSVLDRLLDESPEVSRDAPPSRAEGLRRFRAAVLRDLESLLNTRNPFFDLPVEFGEVTRSGAAYGLPDLTRFSLLSPTDQASLRAAIEQAISTFEPRLGGVSVQVRPPAASATDRTLLLHVEASLLVDPTPEPMTFDIVLPLTTRACAVRESS
jgi:type VI secretion system protein ImpF